MGNKGIRVLIALIGFFLLMRLAVLFSYLDKIYEPEELYRGTIAYEMIHGPKIPLWEYLDYKVEYFPGGTLAVSVLAVPFFLLFGYSYAALKLVGLLFALLTFIFWYVFLERFFNRKTAVICAALSIFCMPFYAKTSLITWGAHPESNFFTILSFFIFYSIFFAENMPSSLDAVYRKNFRLFSLLGLVAGFALWFVQTYLVSLAFILLIWFIFDRRFFLRKPFYVFTAGFLLGISPGIFYSAFYKEGIFAVSGSTLFSEAVRGTLNMLLFNFVPKLIRMLSFDLPKSFLFEKFLFLEGEILSYLYYLIFAAGFFYLAWVNRKSMADLFKNIIYPITLKEVKVVPWAISRESLLLAYILFFSFCYSLSIYSVSPGPWENHEVWLDYIGYRYMIPVIPFILALTGIFLQKIANRKLLFRLLLFLLLGSGLAGNLGMISLNKFGLFNRDRGYSYNILGDKIGLRVTAGVREYARRFEKLNESLKLRFYEGLGAGIAWRLKDEDISRTLETIESGIETRYWPQVYRGWGSIFFLDNSVKFNRAMFAAGSIPAQYRRFFYSGLKSDIRGDPKAVEKAKISIDKVEAIYQPYCYYALGYQIFFAFRGDLKKQAELAGQVSEENREFVYKGISQGEKER